MLFLWLIHKLHICVGSIKQHDAPTHFMKMYFDHNSKSCVIFKSKYFTITQTFKYLL